MFLKQVADLESGLSHVDAELFGFGAAGNNAAVVIGQDDDGRVFQVRSEYFFAGGVEAVTIHECKHSRLRAGGLWCLPAVPGCA